MPFFRRLEQIISSRGQKGRVRTRGVVNARGKLVGKLEGKGARAGVRHEFPSGPLEKFPSRRRLTLRREAEVLLTTALYFTRNNHTPGEVTQPPPLLILIRINCGCLRSLRSNFPRWWNVVKRRVQRWSLRVRVNATVHHWEVLPGVITKSKKTWGKCRRFYAAD